MLHITSQERLALGVTALLIAAGAGVRVLGTEAPPVEWAASADTLTDRGLSSLRAEVDRETAERRIAAQPLRPGERIDPNRATAPELDRLPRVGPALAERIVQHRATNGPFRTLADLDAVAGVGPAMLEALAPHVALPPAPTTRGPSAGRTPEASAPPQANRGGGGRGAGTEQPLNLNTATAEQLEDLPGIGPSLAQRIVRWRAEHGPFRTLEALEEVPGIGPSVRARIAPLVRLDP